MEMESWNDGGSQQELSRGNQTRDDKKPGKTRPATTNQSRHMWSRSRFFLSFLVFKRIKIFISIPNYN
jgi:hypothetical protein